MHRQTRARDVRQGRLATAQDFGALLVRTIFLATDGQFGPFGESIATGPPVGVRALWQFCSADVRIRISRLCVA